MSQSDHPLVALAHRAVQEYVRYGQRLTLSDADPLTTELREWSAAQAGTFVSIHKTDGNLRGCIGTFSPLRENVSAEVIENAVAAASRDPRFYPVQEWELEELEISVDILSAAESIASPAQLDPQVYGVIVTDREGKRRGLLLPMLEQVTTAEQQVGIARQKAFIGAEEPVRLFRFRVQRYH